MTTKALTHTYTVAKDHRLHITYAVFAACAALAIFYAVNLYTVISRTVALGQIQKQEATAAAAVASLNATYFQLSSAITPDTLRHYGMSQGHVSEFISRTASLGSVALRGNEL